MGIELVKGFLILLSYFLVSATIALVLRKCFVIPKEIFRKTLHLILLGSVCVFVTAFNTWWISAIASVLFIILVYPILRFAEKLPGYSELLTERKSGEIKRSLVIVFVMFTVIIVICWGVIGQKYLVLASVFAWGFGDAAAALFGKKYGNIIIESPLVDGKKTVEGTFAMFIVSFISVVSVLLINNPSNWSIYIPIAVITAAVSAIVELISKDGMDTITCPFAAAMVLIPMIHFWGV